MPIGITSSSPLTFHLFSCCHILAHSLSGAFLNFKYSDILLTFFSQNCSINPKFQDMTSKYSFQREPFREYLNMNYGAENKK